MSSKRLVLFSSACIAAAMTIWPPAAAAQVHVGVGVGYHRPYYPYYAPYYRPFYSFYGGWYPFYGAWGYPFWGPYPYPAYPYYYGAAWASARVEVKPRNAQVYVDGYYVGLVDEFDGVFQRLDLPTGDHELSVYMPGHRTYTQRTLFRPGTGYHYKAVLEPLPPGTPDEPAPKPDPNARREGDPSRDAEGYRGDPRDPRGPERTMPIPERQGDRRAPPESRDFGTLNLRVQPIDAVVIIDGERWDSPEGGSRLVVQLTGGSHRIEVRKEGFRTYTSTIQLRPGETQTLNVSLTPGGI